MTGVASTMADDGDGKKYTCHYDSFIGQPTGYTISEMKNGNEKNMWVKCIGANKTQYDFNDWVLNMNKR